MNCTYNQWTLQFNINALSCTCECPTKYFTHLIPYTMGLYTALALAKREPQMVARGLMLAPPNTPT